MNQSLARLFTIISSIASPILLIVLAYYGYQYIQEQKLAYRDIEARFDAQIQLLASTTSSLAESIQIIGDNLSQANSENKDLTYALSMEQERVASLQQEIEKITGTVGTLDKLRKMDPELLQKYSKVYFLNEHYVPSSLADIENKYLYSIKKTLTIHTGVLPHLTKLIDDAATTSTTIYVKSAYRSFYDQVSLKSAYTVTYGAGTANRFSAEQGYSEHQLGTTVDFITTGLGGQLLGFDKTPAYAWLTENAYKYGFTLSYPKNNGYYMYEPWHWRFVGVALATKLHEQGSHFYDTDQRIIDEYLVSMFD